MAKAKHARRSSLALAASAAMFVAAGCSLKQAAPVKQTYLLEAKRAAAPRATPLAPSLRVRELRVTAPFEARSFVYRLGELQYESDFYHEFLVPPRAVLTEQTRQWLADSGLFGSVPGPASKIDAGWVLEGTVSALYGDFRVKGSPKAVVEAQMAVVSSAEAARAGPVIFQRSYRREVALREANAGALARGWNEAFEQMLGALEEDLSRVRWPGP